VEERVDLLQPGGLGDWEGEAVALTLREGLAERLPLRVSEREAVKEGDTLGLLLGKGVAVFAGEVVAVGERVPPPW